MSHAETLSPCRGLCRLDPAGENCTGCRRTLTEIAAWPSLGREERQKILAELPDRLTLFSAEHKVFEDNQKD